MEPAANQPIMPPDRDPSPFLADPQSPALDQDPALQPGASPDDLPAAPQQQADLDTAPPPVESDRRRSSGERWRRIKAAIPVLGLTVLAACSVHKPAPASAEAPTYGQSPTAAASATIDFHERVLSLFSGAQQSDGSFSPYYPTKDSTDQARSILASTPTGLLVPTNQLKTATDYYTAAAATSDVSSYADADSLHTALGETDSITNPALKQQADRAIESTYVAGAIDDAATEIDPSSTPDNSTAEQTLRDDLAPLHDSQLTETAMQVLRLDEAKALLDSSDPGTFPSPKNMKAFLQSVDGTVSSPAARTAIIRAAEADFAGQIISATGQSHIDDTTGELAYYGIDDARKLVDQSITDPGIKEHAMAALSQYSPDGYDAGGYVPDSDDSLTLQTLADKLDDLIKGQDAISDGITLTGNETTVSDYFQDKGDAAVSKDEAALDRVLTNYNGHLTAESVSTIPALADPNAAINLSNVQGTQKIPNLGRFFTSTDEQGSQPDTLNQFAEIYAQDGTLHFDVQTDAKLTVETVTQLRTIFNNVKPILDAAFSSGDLISVHFVIGDDYNPYFLPAAHEIMVVLPQNNVVSMQELQGALVHETSHSLTNTLFDSESAPSKADTALIVNTCRTVRDTTYDTLQAQLQYLYPDMLQNLRDEASPVDKPLIDTIIKAVKDGKLADFFGPQSYESATDNACLPSTPTDLFVSAMYDTANYPETYKEDYDSFSDHLKKTLFKLPAYKKFNDEWVKSTQTYTIYDTLNEANYVMDYTDDPDAIYEGHTEDNATELFASLFDDSVNYPEALGEAIAALPGNDDPDGNQQDASLIAVRTTLTLIAEHHPSLTKLCVERMDKIAAAAGASPDNARYWLPMGH